MANEQNEIRNGNRGAFSIGRLVIGILSILLSLFILFQSCAAGLGNALEENGASSGSMGTFTAIFIMAAGITAICTRNTVKKAGPVAAAILYFIAGAFTIGQGSTFGDLPIWGGISAVMGVFFIICAFMKKKQ